MAASGTVGILRALLTADATAFQKTMKQSADAATGFSKTVAKMGDTAQKVTPQLTRLEKSFSGDKLLYTANNLTRAITNIGGAAKLTAAEQEKVNRQLTTAIDKYRALGQTAPTAMLDLERATRRTETATGGLSTKMVALGSAVGSFIGNFAFNALQQGISSIINLGMAAFDTAEQISDLSKKLGISTDAVQEFQYIADQSGTTVEAFATALNRLTVTLGKGRGDKGGAADLLHEIGLEFDNIRKMNPEEAFRTVLTALAKFPDHARAVFIGTQLMGRGFSELIPAMRDGMLEAAQGVSKMSNETVQNLANAKDAWAKFGRDITIITGNVIGSVYAKWEDLAQRMAKLPQTAAGNLEAAMVGVSEVGGVRPPGRSRKPDIELKAPVAAPVTPQTVTDTPKAYERATTAVDKWTEARIRERQAIEDATQGMTWWLAGMKTVPPTITSAADSLTSDFIPAAQLSTKALEAFMQVPGELAPNFTRELGRVQTYYERVFVPAFERGWDDIAGSAAQAFGDMIAGVRSFKEAYLAIWKSIQQAFANILADMLRDYLQGFLRKALLATAASRLGGPAAALLPNLTTPALLGTLANAAPAALPAALPAAIPPAVPAAVPAAGPGLGGVALAAAPAAGVLLAYGISQRGWFRGGEESVRVNPARDRFFASIMSRYPGRTPYEALVAALADVGVTGGRASSLIRGIYAADTWREWQAAWTALTRAGLTSFVRRSDVAAQMNLPMPSPAMASATSGASTPVPVSTAPVRLSPTSGATPVTMNVTIQAWDRADLNTAFREEIIPRFKDALHSNQAGLRTAVENV